MPTTQFAIPWLKEEDWPRWRLIDPELPPYDRWLAKVNRFVAEAQKKSIVAEKISVDPDVYADWCKGKGKPINRNTRAEYAAAQLMSRTGIH